MKIFTISLLLFFTFAAYGQETIVTNGRSTIEIKISRPQTGTLYYVLYKTKPTTAPSGQTIKADALVATLASAEKKGLLKIASTETNSLLKRHVSGITGTTTDTDKLYYLYMVFEDEVSGFESVISKDIVLKRKQNAQAFKCTKYPHSDPNQTYYPSFDINCLVYFPESYFHDVSNKKYPLILSFHGDGEKGTNELAKVRASFLPSKLEGANFNIEFVVVAPQTNGFKPGWQTPIFLKELLDTLAFKMKIDTSKIYIAGFSGGGGGMCIFSNSYSQKLTAVTTVSGVNSFPSSLNSNYCVLKNVPLGAYHCLDDKTVSSNNAVNLVAGVNQCAPLVKPKTTYFPTGGHISFGQVFQTDSVFRFFLSKSKQNLLGTPLDLNFNSTHTMSAKSSGISEIAIAGFPSTAGLVYKWIKTAGEDLTIVDDNARILKLKDVKGGVYGFRVLITEAKNVVSYKDLTITLTTVTNLDDNALEDYRTNKNSYQIFSVDGKQIRSGDLGPVNLDNIGKGLFIIRQDGRTSKVMVD